MEEKELGFARDQALVSPLLAPKRPSIIPEEI